MTVETGHRSTTTKACRITYLPQMKHLGPWQWNIAAAIYNRRSRPRGVGRPVHSRYWPVLNFAISITIY